MEAEWEAVAPAVPLLINCLLINVGTTADFRKQARLMLMSQFSLFVDSNVKDYVPEDSTFNQKHMDWIIHKLQKLLFTKVCPPTDTKSIIGIFAQRDTEVIEVTHISQSSSGWLEKKRSEETHFGASRTN